MPKLRPISASSSHEEIFAQRYRWLMNWALRLTNHDREQAEDLVHDTFVQFMINRPDLGVVEQNIEGYLYRMLRNMHVSQVRRGLRIRETTFPIADILSISETASVQTELRMAGQRLQIQDELCRICQYASIRKNSSKVGSIVILRFFHGYYPNEIAAVTRSSRAGVDKMLQRARTEARLYLKDPKSLSFLNDEQPAADLQIRFGQEPEDFLYELRKALYASRQNECLSASQLRGTYQTKETDGISPTLLAHIVCCAVCLDEVNRLHGLPLLAEREPEKMTGRDKRDSDKGDGGSDDSSGSTGDFMEGPRLKHVLEHRPKELRVSVNGFILGSHSINSELNRLSISAKGEEKIGFVEVFSEEEVRLLFCVVDTPPEGPVGQRVRANLSDDRSLELFLDFSDSWPALDVTYHDPTFTAEAGALRLESSFEPESEGMVGTASGRERIEVQRPESKVQSPSVESTGLIAWLRRLRSDFGLWTWGFGLLLRPGTVTAVFAFLLVAVLLFLHLRPERVPNASAADLLQQSAAAEEAIAARSDQVVHRTISMEEKKLTGELIARRKLEVWQSREKGVTARRLYDERESLIAGDWRRADGVQTLYAHGRRPQLQLTPEKRGANGPLAFDSIWQLSPSAKEFTGIVARADEMLLEEQRTSYVISYSRQASNAPGLVRATLVLSRADLHPTEQSLIIQQGNEQREFRFIETTYELRPATAVAPSVFEPDAELLSDDTGTRRRGDHHRVPASPAFVLATPELEVEVLGLLHQAGADLGEQITVARTREGEMKVQGLVDSEKRKSQLLAALSPVAENPAVKIQISTVAEATAAAEKQERRIQNRDSSLGAVTVQQVEAVKDAMPAAAELRRYFGGDDEQSWRFASRMINRSHEAMRHAGALKRLLSQFSTQDLRALNPEARGKWLALVRSHANAFQAETAALRQELQPIFFSSSPQGASAESATITNDSELARAVVRLFDLGSANDETVRAAFSISAGVPSRSALITSTFWGLLKSTENLAAAIQKAR